MNNSYVYASIILSIISSSNDKTSAISAIQQNFVFRGALRLDINELFHTYSNCEQQLALEFLNLIEQFHNKTYPYLAGISLRDTRVLHRHLP